MSDPPPDDEPVRDDEPTHDHGAEGTDGRGGDPTAPDADPAAGGEEPSATAGSGGARLGGTPERARTNDPPVDAALAATGTGRIRAAVDALNPVERYVSGAIAAFVAVLFGMVVLGIIEFAYLLFLLSLAGMYMLLSMGLNVQWGYTGLINFSVAAFFGIGAYAAMLLSSGDSPLVTTTVPVLTWPITGVVLALLAGAALAVLIGIPTLSLREDYLAIASLGLAEVVRLIILNQRQWTDGSAGILGMPRFFEQWPVVGGVVAGLGEMALNLLTVVVFLLVVWLFLRRVHRSPWGRVQRIIRADEDLAEALGKDTYAFRMQSFVIGSAIMALAGVFYVHLNNSIFPSALVPIQTFYVWIAVILGGTGSDRGAMVGGFVIITIVEGTRFVGEFSLLGLMTVEPGPLRLFLVGATIIGIMYARPQGILPPSRELIWPAAMSGAGGDSLEDVGRAADDAAVSDAEVGTTEPGVDADAAVDTDPASTADPDAGGDTDA